VTEVRGGGPRRAIWAIGVAAALFALLAVSARGARDDLDLVSRATGGAPADGPSTETALSSDGRFVAFSSEADNLSAEDADGVRDVFVRDLATGLTTLVSRASGPAGAGGDDGSSRPSISADGRLVVFSSFARNLSGDDEDAFEDVFVRDMALGTTTLVSRASGSAGASGDHASFGGVISADGNRVAFVSAAVNLSAVDDPASQDVFVRDLPTATTTLASRATGADGVPADGNSLSPSLSSDGRLVAFSSLASTLSTEDDDFFRDVFVRDLATGATTLVSRAAGAFGGPGDGDSFEPSLSGDGRFVAFSSRGGNLSTEDDDAVEDVFVRDLAVNATLLVSRASGGAATPGDADSFATSISADGSRVAFTSEARNLSAEDGDGVTDVFVRDLPSGVTTLVSRAAGPAGTAADDNAFAPDLSGDGRYVTFHSAADDLSGEDLDAFANVFRRDAERPPAPVAAAALGPGKAGGAHVRCDGVRAGIVGTAHRDVIRGTPGRDVIAALGGNDLVVGRGGNDLVCLGAGDDHGVGGAGADRILGGVGADRVEGNDGPDRLEGGPGRDLLLGGAGRDRLLGLAGRDAGRGGPGADVCRLESARAC
jgi:Tol biopolymer transport system component